MNTWKDVKQFEQRRNTCTTVKQMASLWVVSCTCCYKETQGTSQTAPNTIYVNFPYLRFVEVRPELLSTLWRCDRMMSQDKALSFQTSIYTKIVPSTTRLTYQDHEFHAKHVPLMFFSRMYHQSLKTRQIFLGRISKLKAPRTHSAKATVDHNTIYWTYQFLGASSKTPFCLTCLFLKILPTQF